MKVSTQMIVGLVLLSVAVQPLDANRVHSTLVGSVNVTPVYDDEDSGVIEYLSGMEGFLHSTTRIFYRFFGRNVDPAKLAEMDKCNREHKLNKSVYCGAPVFNPREIQETAGTSPTGRKIPPNPAFIGTQNPNLPKGYSTTGKEEGFKKIGEEEVVSIPSKCLEDADAAECQKWRRLTASDFPGFTTQQGTTELERASDGGGPPPGDDDDDGDAEDTAGVTDVLNSPTGAAATPAPSMYLCFGNHAKNDENANHQQGDLGTYHTTAT